MNVRRMQLVLLDFIQIQSIGDFKNLQPDTAKQFKQSLSELQNELQIEKDNCCVDCD